MLKSIKKICKKEPSQPRKGTNTETKNESQNSKEKRD